MGIKAADGFRQYVDGAEICEKRRRRRDRLGRYLPPEGRVRSANTPRRREARFPLRRTDMQLKKPGRRGTSRNSAHRLTFASELTALPLRASRSVLVFRPLRIEISA